MPWSLALSAVRMKLATLRPGIAVGYWKARNRPSRARLSGDSLRMSRPFQMTSPACDHVGRVAHQRVGEGRLARAVGAHDRVDLALADGQVDPLEDLVLGVGDRRDAQAADDQLLVGVGRSRVGQGSLQGGLDGGRASRSGHEVGEGHRVEGAGDRVADADPQDVDGAARRAIAQAACSGSSLAQIIGAIGPSSARSTSRHRDRLGRRGPARSRRARRGCWSRARPRAGSPRAARGRRAAGPPRRRSRPGWPARVP